MNRMTTILAAFMLASSAWADYDAVQLDAGDNLVPAPCSGVMLHAISTNASGTVVLKKVTALSITWNETRTVTNIIYTTAWSNLTHTVTNDMVSAWRTNAVTVAGTTNTVVETNFLARAMNAIPSVYPWPDLLITTNKLTGVEVYANIPYKVESSRRVMPYTIQRRASKYVTNDICNVTLSSGFKTNAVSGIFAPGDFIYASGTAFKGGRVQLIISK